METRMIDLPVHVISPALLPVYRGCAGRPHLKWASLYSLAFPGLRPDFFYGSPRLRDKIWGLEAWERG